MEFKFRADPALVTVIMHRLESIAREMGITMERTSRSPIYAFCHDFSTALLDRSGRLVAQVEHIPIQMAGCSFACRAVLEIFRNEIFPGDLILLNDPYTLDGGNHLPDWTLLLPVFNENKLVFWAFSRAHMMDVGGGAPGGYNPTATDIFMEGFRITPIKIYEKGQPKWDVLNLIMANVRYPDIEKGDLLSMIGSLKIGERRLIELVEKYGLELIEMVTDDLNGYAEYLMRAEISKLPEGTYRGEQQTGRDTWGGPYSVKAAVTVKRDQMTVDFTGSDKQTKGCYNSSFSNTCTSVYVAILTAIGAEVPHTEGCYAPIKIIAPKGIIVNCSYPAACTMATIFPAQTIIEAVWKALSKTGVKHLQIAGWGGWTEASITGSDPRTNKRFSSLELQAAMAGAGAVYGLDGWNCIGQPVSGGALNDPNVEMYEVVYPFLIGLREHWNDSGGPGKWRGGLGTHYEFIYEGASEGRAYFWGISGLPSYGVMGGKQGKINEMYVVRDGEKIEIPLTGMVEIKPGDKVVFKAAGGGGVGDPLERDIEKVWEDVQNDYISAETAQKDYGVEINPDGSVARRQSKRIE